MPSLESKIPAAGAYQRLLAYARPYLLQWLIVGVILLASSAMAVLQPLPMQVLMDHVLDNQPVGSALAHLTHILPGASSKSGLLTWVAITSLLIYVISSLIDGVVSYAWIRVGQRMVYDLSRDLFSATQRQSLQFHAKHAVGDSMSRIMTDSWVVYNVVESLILTPAQAIITAAVMITIMARMNVQLTIVSVIAAPIIIAGLDDAGQTVATIRTSAARNRKRHAGACATGAQRHSCRAGLRPGDARAGALHQLRRPGHSRVSPGRAGDESVQPLFRLGADARHRGRAAHRRGDRSSRRLPADDPLTFGKLLIFLAYLATLQGQISTLARGYIALQSRRAEIERVTEYLATPNAIRDSPTAIALPSVRGDVSIEGVTFGYEPDRPVLRDVTLTLRAGQTIALVGATGAGKSTLASLVPRFFDPWEGCVRIDGRDLREVRVRDLRENISLVLQESFLFPISIAQNIAFGKPNAPREEIIRAAEAANAAEFIADLPDGYDSIIGERGADPVGRPETTPLDRSRTPEKRPDSDSR